MHGQTVGGVFNQVMFGLATDYKNIVAIKKLDNKTPEGCFDHSAYIQITIWVICTPIISYYQLVEADNRLLLVGLQPSNKLTCLDQLQLLLVASYQFQLITGP